MTELTDKQYEHIHLSWWMDGRMDVMRVEKEGIQYQIGSKEEG